MKVNGGPLYWIKFLFTSRNKSLLLFVALRELFRDSAKMNFKSSLSWCQSGGTRGEGFGKFHIYVLLTQSCPRAKMRLSMLGISHNIICASAQYVEGTARARGTFDRCVLAGYRGHR